MVRRWSERGGLGGRGPLWGCVVVVERLARVSAEVPPSQAGEREVGGVVAPPLDPGWVSPASFLQVRCSQHPEKHW